MKFLCGVGTSAIRKQAIKEFKNRIARSVTRIQDNMVIVDRNQMIQEEENAKQDREEALQLMQQAIEELQKAGKTVTKETILSYLMDIDFRNKKYGTWIGILYDELKQSQEQQEEEPER